MRKLCPDGVEYKKLRDFATISRGGNFQKKDFVESGIPCIHYGQIYTHYSLFVDTTFTFISESCARKQKMAMKNDVVMTVTSENIEDVCKCLAWLGEDDVAVSGHAAIIHHNQNPKYLVYYFHSEMFFAQKRKLAHGTKVIEVTPDKLYDINVPIPPLQVQSEIVRILDNFTDLTAELTAKLKAELSARKKQDKYYRDILIFGVTSNCAKKFLLDEISEFVTVGIANSATHAYSDSGVIMFRNQNIKANQLDDSDLIYILPEFAKKYETKSLKKNDILVTRTGYPGQACLVPQKYEGSQTFTTLIVRLKKTREVSPAYVSYFINSGLGKAYVDKMKSGAAQQNFGAKSLEKMPILLPPIEKQEKIVAILDRLDSLTNDISTGLPAEIEARQKQYEYYRDKLLTFKELA